MARKYHLKENGEPGVCTASVKACPLGAAPEDHYPTKKAARQAYEAQQAAEAAPPSRRRAPREVPLSPQEAAYTSRMADAVRTLREEVEEDPEAEVPAYAFSKALKKTLEESLGRKVFEEDLHGPLKVVVARLQGESLQDPRTWEALYRGVKEELKAPTWQQVPTEEERSLLESGRWQAHAGGSGVGSPAVAEALRGYVLTWRREHPQEELREGLEDAPPPGFTPLGSGGEQVALLHEESRVVYKVPHWGGEEGMSTQGWALNALRGQEAFPSSCGRAAAVSAYADPRCSLVAQEYVDGPPFRETPFTVDQRVWMEFAGHNDLHDGNYLQGEAGEVVAFDTCGRVYEDIEDAYVPPRLGAF